MATKTARIRFSSVTPSQLDRLAIVFADPIRLKIVTELFRQEMSPSGFFEAHGGGSLGRVNKHFRRLADTGWLRLVRTEQGGRRRGGTEHFYRAPELAIIEDDVWARLPPALRTEYSWRTFEQFAERVRDGLEAETFDRRPERHFTWTPLVLDEKGRTRVLAACMAVFRSLLEEQADAKVRLAAGDETPMEATVGMAVFDSPRKHRNRSGLLLPVAAGDESAQATHFTVRIARVLSHPVNLKIVTELNLREMSASGFFDEFGGVSRSDVNRRFKLLTRDGWLSLVRAETGGKRRGATEHFYRATGPAIFDTTNWSQVPEKIRGTYSWHVFEQLAEQVREAMDAGTFDSRPDRHETWMPLVLDEVGWAQVVASIDSLFESLLQEQALAKMRLNESEDEPLIATSYLAAFESPLGSAVGSGLLPDE